jgi:hypothetical protein
MFRAVLKRRFVSFALLLAVGFLLLVSLTLSTGLTALTNFVVARVPLSVSLISLGNEALCNAGT